MLTDTHIHLYLKEFDKDRAELMEKAKNDHSINRFFLPNIDSTSIDPMLELAEFYPGICYPMMGLHPCSVKKNFEKELYLVEDWLKKYKFYGIGEVGIDLYWDKTTLDLQFEAFEIQIGFARNHNLPLIIHSRNSFNEIIEFFTKKRYSGLKGIFHCFSGTYEEALQAIGLGFYLGIGGVVTFKNSGLDKVVKELDLKHIVLETDAPYLAPVPHRGKRNEPSYLNLVAAKIAFCKGIDQNIIEMETSENSELVFGI